MIHSSESCTRKLPCALLPNQFGERATESFILWIEIHYTISRLKMLCVQWKNAISCKQLRVSLISGSSEYCATSAPVRQFSDTGVARELVMETVT